MIKILIDLDVVTVGMWDKGVNGDLARKFISRVKNKEFCVVTPFYLIEHVFKWKNQWLKEAIENFYIKETDALLSNEDIDSKIAESDINDKKVLLELQSKNIKEEDAFIVLVTSMQSLDYLITFNRIHLKNKKEVINEVLKKNGLKPINITGPEEV